MERPDPTASPHEEEEEEIDEGYYIDVEIEDSRFEPAAIQMSVAQELEPFNHDSVLHNVSIAESGMSFDVEPGVKELYTPPVVLPPGTYAFFCRFHRAAGMRGTITMSSDREVITLKRGY
jgi:plastocyanin